MASDDNDPRRNRDRLDENNPFITFRRFADSQVSSLLNTVFTLPATIANYRNVHIAREQCLFGRADKEKCQELHQFEEETRELLAECRDMYRAGNVEGALAKGEEMLHLNHSADLLRKQIVEDGGGTEMSRRSAIMSEAQEASSMKELVEKVANEKAQQWGLSWDWGFPRPFDTEEDASTRYDRCRRWRRRRQESAFPAEPTEEHSNAPEEGSWPLEDERWVQRQLFTHELNEVLLPFFQDLVRGEETATDRLHAMRQSSEIVAEMARAAGVPRDAYEDLVRCQNGLPLMHPERLGQSDHLSLDDWARRFWDRRDRYYAGWSHQNTYPKRVPWEGEETAEEPNYEYSHDHEDQHDEPPTPKVKQGDWSSDIPETELEAYERLLGPTPSPGDFGMTDGRPSVLSTLTTTERTVAPDGTVTTKVVLKKRFTDGREESSETVHTQRGHEDQTQRTGCLSNLLESAVQHKAQEQPRKTDDNKKGGWFWAN